MDWNEKKLSCEIQVKETVRDVKFLHDYKMFAVSLFPFLLLLLHPTNVPFSQQHSKVAQKKYVYIYDNQGIELHKLKNHLEPSHLEFLPYHFLLVSASRLGFLKYHDISTGSIVSGNTHTLLFIINIHYNVYYTIFHNNNVVNTT